MLCWVKPAESASGTRELDAGSSRWEGQEEQVDILPMTLVR